MQKISGFIISFLLLVPALCRGQDTVRYPINAMKGVRVGVDVSKPLLPLMSNNRQFGIEAAVDKHIWENMFGVIEAGWLRVNLENDTAYHYRSNGVYGKLGIDYNLLKSRRPYSNDILYAGVRYGMSVFSHQADNITIPGYYWPDAHGQNFPKTMVNTHWMELLMGVKAEVLKNFYIGLTFRFKFKIVSPKDNYSKPYRIPGYGSGTEGYSLGLNYYLSYNINF
jgi:hypothetical protein